MSWAIWITGPSGQRQVGDRAGGRGGAARRCGQPVKRLELDEIRKSVTPAPALHGSRARRSSTGRWATWRRCSSRPDTPVLIDATAHRRVWRDLVRAAVPALRRGAARLPARDLPGAGAQPRAGARAPRHLPAGRAPGRHRARRGRALRAGPGSRAPDRHQRADASDEAVEQVVRLAGGARAGRRDRRRRRRREPGWAIWITGRPGSGKSTLAQRVTRGPARAGQPACACSSWPRCSGSSWTAGRATTPSRTSSTARWPTPRSCSPRPACRSSWTRRRARRAWREAARELIPCFAEVQLLCPTEICLERERAVRWGLTFEAPAAPAAAAAGHRPRLRGVHAARSGDPDRRVRSLTPPPSGCCS